MLVPAVILLVLALVLNVCCSLLEEDIDGKEEEDGDRREDGPLSSG